MTNIKSFSSAILDMRLKKIEWRLDEKRGTEVKSGQDQSEDEITFLGNKIGEMQKEFQVVLWYFETHWLMHRLAANHFKCRAKWCSFLPILAVTTTVSVLGFLANSEDFTGDERHKKNWSLGAGLLGVLATFLASLGKYNNYQSKGDMHEAAEMTLSNICNAIKLEDISFERKKNAAKYYQIEVRSRRQEAQKNDERRTVLEGKINDRQKKKTEIHDLTENDDLNKYEAELEKLNEIKNDKIDSETMEENHHKLLKTDGVSLESYKTKFETMQESCSSPIPSHIEHTFLKLRDVFEPASHDILKRYLYPRCYKALWREFVNSPIFPLFLPKINIEDVCDTELAVSELKAFYPDEFLKKEFLKKKAGMSPELDREVEVNRKDKDVLVEDV